MKKISSASTLLPSLGLLYGAFGWGVIWYPYRLLAQSGLCGLQASLFTFLAALIIGVVMFTKHWRAPWSFPNGMLPLALAAGWANIAYIIAVLDGEVVRVMLLFFLSPVWTLLLAHLWLKEPVRKKHFFVIIIALLGAFIMLYRPDHQLNWWQQLPLPANDSEWWALSAGVAFALSNVISRRSAQLSLLHKSFAVWLGVIVIALVMLGFYRQPVMPALFTLQQGYLVIGIGLLLVSVTFTVQYGVSKMPATRASVLFLFELVVAAIAAYYLADETLGLFDYIGGFMIMIASVLAVSDD